MHDQSLRPTLLGAGAQAVLLVWPQTGHAQQARGFVEHQQVLVLVDQLHFHHCVVSARMRLTCSGVTSPAFCPSGCSAMRRCVSTAAMSRSSSSSTKGGMPNGRGW